MAAVIECRTLDGQTWLSVRDVTAALRDRANDFAEACNASDDDLTATAYRAVTEELRSREVIRPMAATKPNTPPPSRPPRNPPPPTKPKDR